MWLDKAHPLVVMPVRIVSVPLEMRAQGLDASVGAMGQIDPTVTCTLPDTSSSDSYAMGGDVF